MGVAGLARTIGTVGGIGYLRPAPGTWASLGALPLAWALHVWGGFPLLLGVTAGFLALGWWATAVLLGNRPLADPPEIVVDEVVGQWIALWAISFPAWQRGIEVTALWPGWIAAFLLFRLFDIWKPGPVGRFDRMGGAGGVMLDDVAAGILAALGVVVLAVVAHGLIGT